MNSQSYNASPSPLLCRYKFTLTLRSISVPWLGYCFGSGQEWSEDLLPSSTQCTTNHKSGQGYRPNPLRYNHLLQFQRRTKLFACHKMCNFTVHPLPAIPRRPWLPLSGILFTFSNTTNVVILIAILIPTSYSSNSCTNKLLWVYLNFKQHPERD